MSHAIQQRGNIQFFTKSLNFVVEMEQFWFNGQQVLFQSLETDAFMTDDVDEKSNLVEDESGLYLFERPQSRCGCRLVLHGIHLMSDVFQSQFILSPQAQDVLCTDDLLSDSVLQLIGSFFQLVVLFGTASARALIQLIVEHV